MRAMPRTGNCRRKIYAQDIFSPSENLDKAGRTCYKCFRIKGKAIVRS